MKTAIHYSAVKTTREKDQVWGVQVAILEWLSAYMTYGTQEQIPFLISDSASLSELRDFAYQNQIDVKRIIPLDARFPVENFGAIDVIFRADPDPMDLFWQRAYAPHATFAFCGLAHALAGREAGELLEKYALSPSSIGDAIICPSRAIQSVIRSYWMTYADYIAERFNGQFTCPVDLPVIPLGLHAEKITKTLTPENRHTIRAQLGADDDSILILWVGRLSSANKAHPLPMFQAIEQTAQKTKKKIIFVMQGYFQPENAADEFAKLARDVCPHAPIIFIESQDNRFPEGLWAGADIFMSLVDNVQESFGLTPIEAIAAGLPRILSDWNGYKECATHGEDAFLVPTCQPSSGAGDVISSLALGKKEMYGGILAKLGQTVAVDAEKASHYLTQLVNDPALRHRLADCAKTRLIKYNWKTVIQSQESLWLEQKEKKSKRIIKKDWKSVLPQIPDPYAVYASYPTAQLSPNDRFAIAQTAEAIRMLWRHPMNVIALDLMIDVQSIMLLLNQIDQRKTASVEEIYSMNKQHDTYRTQRTITWLYKLGILSKVET